LSNLKKVGCEKGALIKKKERELCSYQEKRKTLWSFQLTLDTWHALTLCEFQKFEIFRKQRRKIVKLNGTLDSGDDPTRIIGNTYLWPIKIAHSSNDYTGIDDKGRRNQSCLLHLN